MVRETHPTECQTLSWCVGRTLHGKKIALEKLEHFLVGRAHPTRLLQHPRWICTHTNPPLGKKPGMR